MLDESSKALVIHQPPAPPTKRPYTRRNPDGPRVPPADGDIQSNFCRNINCDNFGVTPKAHVPKGRPKKGEPSQSDGYQISAHDKKGRKRLVLFCTKCGQQSSLKNNTGIREELDRISAYLMPPPAPSCPNEACENHGVSALDEGSPYRSHGYTGAGSPRWRCKACGTVFSARKPRKQLKSSKNSLVFRLLVNKNSIHSISRVADIGLRTVYDKIGHIHRQCLAFLADREAQIASLGIRRLNISVDRQDYILNWSNMEDRRNTQLTAVASADNRSGYVFGMNVNFDPAIDTEKMEAEAIVAGDFEKMEPSFRKFARFWTTPDFEETRRADPGYASARGTSLGNVVDDIVASYREIAELPDPEAFERPLKYGRLPAKGAQIHYEYTVHAHFRLLRRLLGDVGKVRFFMDQDETLRSGCISTFVEEMKAGKADAFYVKIDKGLTGARQLGWPVRRQLGWPVGGTVEWRYTAIMSRVCSAIRKCGDNYDNCRCGFVRA